MSKQCQQGRRSGCPASINSSNTNVIPTIGKVVGGIAGLLFIGWVLWQLLHVFPAWMLVAVAIVLLVAIATDK